MSKNLLMFESTGWALRGCRSFQASLHVSNWFVSSLNLNSVAIIWSQLNTFCFWTVDYFTMLEHNLYTNWKVFLKINQTLTPKKTYVKFCCVGRNHTSLKNTSTTSTYFLQSKPLLVDPRECSLMNLTNLITTMVAVFFSAFSFSVCETP